MTRCYSNFSITYSKIGAVSDESSIKQCELCVNFHTEVYKSSCNFNEFFFLFFFFVLLVWLENFMLFNNYFQYSRTVANIISSGGNIRIVSYNFFFFFFL